MTAHPLFSALDVIFVAGLLNDAEWVEELARGEPRDVTSRAAAAAAAGEQQCGAFAEPGSVEQLHALYWAACATGNVDAAMWMLQRGADANSISPMHHLSDAVMMAADRGYDSVIRALSVTARVPRNLLFAACLGGLVDVVTNCINNGYDISSEYGITEQTPIEIAVDDDHLDVINALLYAGADVSEYSHIFTGLLRDRPSQRPRRLELFRRMLTKGAEFTGDDFFSRLWRLMGTWSWHTSSSTTAM